MLDLLSLESHSVSESHLHFERALQSWLAWRLSPAICLRHKCKLILTSWTLLRCFSSQQVTLQPFMFWVKESGIIIRDQCELDMLNICLMTLQMYCNDLLPCPCNARTINLLTTDKGLKNLQLISQQISRNCLHLASLASLLSFVFAGNGERLEMSSRAFVVFSTYWNVSSYFQLKFWLQNKDIYRRSLYFAVRWWLGYEIIQILESSFCLGFVLSC